MPNPASFFAYASSLAAYFDQTLVPRDHRPPTPCVVEGAARSSGNAARL
jgi:hypothetical protein